MNISQIKIQSAYTLILEVLYLGRNLIFYKNTSGIYIGETISFMTNSGKWTTRRVLSISKCAAVLED